MNVTQEIVENVALAYAVIIDKYTTSPELDSQMDGGEFSSPSTSRQMDHEIEQMFIEQAREYEVDPDELKYKVYELLNTPEDEIDHSMTMRTA